MTWLLIGILTNAILSTLNACLYAKLKTPFNLFASGFTAAMAVIMILRAFA